MPLIECVPNISEGRNRETIDAVARAVEAAGGRMLDLHMDADHHRSVLTFVGDPEVLADAALGMVREAVDRIDLRGQHGVHPRVGAVDVIPFVPLRDATMADAVVLAQRAGRSIADRLGIPVFLYEEAASSTHRRNLATIRRGQFERLGAKLAQPDWAPDFGPSRPHPTAGLTVVGARTFLVAFNVVLDTEDLSIAQRIAATIREADGGLAGVKALGLPLASCGAVQVSMNLTRPDATDVPEAYSAVARHAADLGVAVRGSEIVGLVPRAAVHGATTESLRLDRDLESVVLENRLGWT